MKNAAGYVAKTALFGIRVCCHGAEVPVCMTNFGNSRQLCGQERIYFPPLQLPLLIIDDFGMERGTEYGLEQVYSCD